MSFNEMAWRRMAAAKENGGSVSSESVSAVCENIES
jgi:hypothetical protein